MQSVSLVESLDIARMGWLTVGNQVSRVIAIDACHIGLESVTHSFV